MNNSGEVGVDYVHEVWDNIHGRALCARANQLPDPKSVCDFVA